MMTRHDNDLFYLLFVFLCLPTTIFSYDCREICNVTVHVVENTPTEQLKWNLIELLQNRTTSRTIPFEYLQFSLSTQSFYFQIESPILQYILPLLDREELCPTEDNEPCAIELQLFTQTSFILLFKMIVADENDWRPSFDRDRIDLLIRENLPVDYRVQLPVAHDRDSSLFNVDRYEFVQDDEQQKNLFALEQDHDELRLKLLKSLDCEEKMNYQLQIIAIDKGGLKSNILHVNVTVDDVNEYQPRFKQRLYHTRIPENLSIENSTILTVEAIDDDCHAQTIFYSLLIGDIPLGLFPFEIDQNSGSISLVRPLDYETTSSYRFRVKASDLDRITSTIVPVIVDIVDVNDNQPLLQINVLGEYKFKSNEAADDGEENMAIVIDETIRMGQVIGTVLIRDGDSPAINRRLSLRIVSCWPTTIVCPIVLDSGLSEGFSDDETDEIGPTTYLIRTARQLDSEAGDERFMIVFETRDNGDPPLSSQRRLIVMIRDQNDCSPHFSQSNYQFRLSDSASNGSFIGQVQASDGDRSLNFSLIRYSLLESEHRPIEIDPNNGTLYLVTKYIVGKTFNMTVIAVDQHNRSLYDQAQVVVTLYDEATCTPSFTQTLYVFNASEHRATPFDIGRVQADSCTMSSFPMLSYHLVKDASSSSLPFYLDAHTGALTGIRELDREQFSSYQFQVDSLLLDNHRSSRTRVQINVLDENDHPPVFDNSISNTREQYVFINTSSSSSSSLQTITRRHHSSESDGILIGRVHATDADAGLNGLVNYHFTNNDHYAYFHLFSNGSIVLYNQEDLHLPYRLEIYARDQGRPIPLNSRESIVIYVCDAAKRDECPSDDRVAGTVQQQHWLMGYSDENRSKSSNADFYLGSIFIMISVMLFVLILIVCIAWNVFIKVQITRKENSDAQSSTQSYNCRVEARKNLIVSDSLYESSPNIDAHHRLKSVAV